MSEGYGYELVYASMICYVKHTKYQNSCFLVVLGTMCKVHLHDKCFPIFHSNLEEKVNSNSLVSGSHKED